MSEKVFNGYRFMIASDIIRDGIGCELYDSENNFLAEIFRNDARRIIEFTCNVENIPFVVIEKLSQIFKDEIGNDFQP
jgi:hypothetical protein